jgi:cyclic pyranopterin phosphate synthase
LPVAASAADTLGRPLRDLRISVTDRRQFRCSYCMPREIFGRDFAFLPREELLTFEELTRLARVFAGLGVRKLRLTGGEPLLRRDRGATGRQGPRAGRCGPAPRHGQPRFAG